MGVTPNLVPAENCWMRGIRMLQQLTERTGTAYPERVDARPMAATTSQQGNDVLREA